MPLLTYVLDARGVPQPHVEWDPERYMKGMGAEAVAYEVWLSPGEEYLSLDSLVARYPCPRIAPAGDGPAT